MLSCKGLSVAYGGIPALQGIDLTIPEGGSLGVLGPNGAGKTTLLSTLAGLLTPMQGSIHFGGIDVTRLSAAERVRLGMVLVPEGRRVFSDLSIEENLLVGAHLRTDHRAVRTEIEKLFVRFPFLRERRREAAGVLSGGQQQLLAIGRAVMAHPRLLLLDEPTMGLSPAASGEVGDYLEELAKGGLALVLSGQNRSLILRYCDEVIALRLGCMAYKGHPSGLDSRAVERIYLS